MGAIDPADLCVQIGFSSCESPGILNPPGGVGPQATIIELPEVNSPASRPHHMQRNHHIFGSLRVFLSLKSSSNFEDSL